MNVVYQEELDNVYDQVQSLARQVRELAERVDSLEFHLRRHGYTECPGCGVWLDSDERDGNGRCAECRDGGCEEG